MSKYNEAFDRAVSKVEDLEAMNQSLINGKHHPRDDIDLFRAHLSHVIKNLGTWSHGHEDRYEKLKQRYEEALKASYIAEAQKEFRLLETTNYDVDIDYGLQKIRNLLADGGIALEDQTLSWYDVKGSATDDEIAKRIQNAHNRSQFLNAVRMIEKCWDRDYMFSGDNTDRISKDTNKAKQMFVEIETAESCFQTYIDGLEATGDIAGDKDELDQRLNQAIAEAHIAAAGVKLNLFSKHLECHEVTGVPLNTKTAAEILEGIYIHFEAVSDNKTPVSHKPAYKHMRNGEDLSAVTERIEALLPPTA